MTFAKKIFIAIFLSTMTLGCLLISVSYEFFEHRSHQEFTARYSGLTKILSDALTRLDVSTEALMHNAALYIAEVERQKGSLSTDELRALRTHLGVTHAFVIDANGDFRVSTNEAPETIPNLFSFSPQYRKLLTGESDVEATPVIMPKPEKHPFKFLSVANADRTRIIEVGVRVDFIARTLAEAVESDAGVVSMSLYSPDGTQFGTFSPDGFVFDERKATLPQILNQPIDDGGENIRFYSKVSPSHISCGQCDVAQTSVEGEYYYVLESTVSKKALVATRELAFKVAIGFLFLNALASFVAAKLISAILSKNIQQAVARVGRIRESGMLSERVGMKGGNEVAYLTNEFDRMLDALESAQEQVRAASAMKSRVEIARVVGHNIRSPLLALEMMLPALKDFQPGVIKVFKSAITEMKELTLQLKNESEGNTSGASVFDLEAISLKELLDEVVAQKSFENSDEKAIAMNLDLGNDSRYWVRANRNQLKGVLSNLVNNSVEAMHGRLGRISMRVRRQENRYLLRISDEGVGISPDVIEKLGTSAFSTKHGVNRGIGVMHAKSAVEAFGGSISYSSTVGRGTTVTIALPCDSRAG